MNFFTFRSLLLALSVQSYPTTSLNEKQIKQFEVLRELGRQDILREYNLKSIDELNMNNYSDDLSKYNLTKEQHELGLKVYRITYDFLKTGNIQEFADAIVKNRDDILKFENLMYRLEPVAYPTLKGRYEDIVLNNKLGQI